MDYRIERWKQPFAPEAEKLQSLLESEGYRVFQWSDAPGAFYPPHEHARDQSHWIISGALELTIENVGTFVLSPGDRDLMPARTKHSARVLGDAPVVYLIGEKV